LPAGFLIDEENLEAWAGAEVWVWAWDWASVLMLTTSAREQMVDYQLLII
jgi:hypothetical protein